ncbi:MAG: c-type cytochrome [Sphingobium sp.]
MTSGKRTVSHDHRSKRMRLAGIALIVAAGLALILGIRHQIAQAEVLRADPDRILSNFQLRVTALAGGKTVFERHCASCHGGDGRRNEQRGIPDLADADHLYGTGMVSEIEQIVRYGIRAHDKRGWTLASMPAYASAVPYASEPLPPQTPDQIEALTQFLLSFTGRSTNPAAAQQGKAQYVAAGCWDCHGHNAEGDEAVGAPTLTDDIWLYGGSHDDIQRSIARGRAGYSPAFVHQLSAAELRDVAVYVAAFAEAPTPIYSREAP